ncbi:MAG: putative Na+/H+ antiporter [Opitutales bacterium]|nr:putative Na+/H+ antiporter [Opitutales bacterium]
MDSTGHEVDESGLTRIPPPLEEYQRYERENHITGVWNILKSRAKQTPFNVVATAIFLLSVLHTFLAGPISKYAHKLEEKHKERIIREGRTAEAKPFANAKDDVSVWGQVLHLFGEVEAVFGIWLIPLMIAVTFFYSFKDFAYFVDYKVNYTEPMFVVVIMAMAHTRPIIRFAERCLRFIARRLGTNTPAAWWISILIVGPLLGSFITEPAAMTISAILLSRMFYRFNPSPTLKYATLGLLFVNISVGGTLTHFAAPPVLMVAGVWGWDMKFMFLNYGWKATIGILVATGAYYYIFRAQFATLAEKVKSVSNYGLPDGEEPVPMWIIINALGFMAWTVITVHHPPMFIGGFLFFIAFYMATKTWQGGLSIRAPLLVGLFLAALVTHGKLQQWWIEPVLASMSDVTLFLSATVLTAFNDNAAITFLASQVPEFANNSALQHAVVYGAVTGGGLTVIANAPNPAGQSLLNGFFSGGISPLKLLLAALIPTVIMGTAFWFLPNLC